MQRLPRARLLLAAVALLLPVLAACGDDDEGASTDDTTDATTDATEPSVSGVEPSQELIDAAIEEGKVVWYSPFADGPSSLVAEAFEEKYPGIDVEYTRLGTGPLLQRYTAERDAGTVVADVVTAADPQFYVDAEGKGWIEPLDEEVIPAMADFPEEFTGASGNYVTINIAPHGIIYNTDLVDVADLEDWRSVADPVYRDQGVVMVDPRKVPAFGMGLVVMEDLYGEEFISEELAEQNIVLSESAIPAAQQVAAGESAIGFPSIPSVIVELKAQGAPIEIFIPDDTSSTDCLAAISTDAPHPNAAKLFFNFLAGVEGQTVLNKDVSVSPLASAGVREIAGTIPFPSGYVPPDVPKAIEERDRFISLLGLQ